ncbi:hypothetical protein QBC42DRAFT_32982 [Cladorrhinum samala]|uniref:Uncharacterized protein n=1 Tax=Cladorrhinum samala TaxID=585594 RepID=A0AAV9HYX2_9PEZI|nr:hypothetical protein QBC42DRAFT_32982 [Cladorrhinum samala]
MSGFPTLVPAFTASLSINAPSQITPNLRHVAVVPDISTLVSEPSYPIKLDAVMLHGADFIRVDADGRNARLEVQSLVKDKATGGLVRLNYTGTVNLEGPNGKVLNGEADAATTNFGQAFIHVVFESSDPSLAALQTKTYVGSGRFILEAGKAPVVEYKISEVVHN